MSRDLPSVTIRRVDLEAGLGVLGANVAAGPVASNSEARRQIRSGGLRVNDVVVTDEARLLTPADLTAEGVIKPRSGARSTFCSRPA